ncbi:hypothetical protein [Shinella sp. BYT-45]|uniref:hypothetical protein n=1 Tax=Shinella sp. BYT-45 TaxID=3377377 RepID=UPI003980EB9F
MADRPMWCDDFDMDLPKVVPGAREAVGEAGGIVLFTYGHTTHGTLNLPCMWNSCEGGTLAFFGFSSPAAPRGFTTSSPVVECTGWEMFRDLWVHGTAAYVERFLVWKSEELNRDFENIMWNLRGWGDASSRTSQRRRRMGELRALISIRQAAQRLVELHKHYEGLRR